MSRNTHPLLATELLVSSLDSQALTDLLSQLIVIVNDTADRLNSLSTDYEKHQLKISERMSVVESAQKGTEERLCVCEDGAKKIAKFEAWSERFTELEKKHFELSSSVDKRLTAIEDEFRTKRETDNEELRKVVRQLEKNEKQRYEEMEDQVLRLRMDINHLAKQHEDSLLALQKETEMVTQTTTLSTPESRTSVYFPPAQVDPETPAPRKSEEPATFSLPPSLGLRLSQVDLRLSQVDLRLDQVDLRLRDIERRLSVPVIVSTPKPASPIHPTYLHPPADVLETKLRVAIMHDVEVRHQTLVHDIADLRSSFLESLRHHRTESAAEAQKPPAASSEMKEVNKRISALESAMHQHELERKKTAESQSEAASFIVRQATAEPASLPEDEDHLRVELEALSKAVKEDMARLQAELLTLRESVRNFSPSTNFVPMMEDIERLKLVATRSCEEIQFLAGTVQSIKERIGEKPPTTATESAGIAYRLSALLVATKSLSMGAPQKLVTELRGSPRSSSHHSTTVSYTAHLELLQGFEVQLTNLRHDVEKLRLDITSRDRELDEVNQHFERLENLFQGSLERMQIDMNQKMDGVMELLDRPADHPDATKNLTALRGVIHKLQKEIRDLAAQKSIPVDPPLDGSSPSKATFVHIHKLETQIKTLESRFTQVSSDLDAMQQWMKRNAESQGAARLAEMETFRGEVEKVLGKVMDGVKLNKRDFENLSELYEKIDMKGDKSELAQKVDKTELRKAYAKLQTRIDAFREDLKHLSEPCAPPCPEEAAASTRRVNTGCLSCGQGVPSLEPTEREWKYTSHFPVRPGLHKYGHGFSKLLPILDCLVSPKGRATEPGRNSKTERGKFQRSHMPDSYSSLSAAFANSPSLATSSSHL